MLSGKKRRHAAAEEKRPRPGMEEEEDDEDAPERDGGAAQAGHTASVAATPSTGSGRGGARGAAGGEAGGGADMGEGAGDDGAGLGLDLDPSKLPAMGPQEMQELLDKFTPDQMSRYEHFRRSALNKAMVKKLVSSVSGTNVGPNVNIVLAGIAKLFVGEMVETARMVMSERGDEGPIRPIHLREAHRRLRLANRIPSRSRAPLFL